MQTRLAGLSRPGLAWRTSSLARSLARARRARLLVCSSARVYLPAVRVRVHAHMCNRLANSETSTEEQVRARGRRGPAMAAVIVVVSRGWTAYLLGTISLSGWNAHAYIACTRRTRDPPISISLSIRRRSAAILAITCINGVPLYRRLQRGEEARDFVRYIYLRMIRIELLNMYKYMWSSPLSLSLNNKLIIN